MRALIDADVLVYQSAQVATTTAEFNFEEDLVLFPSVSVAEATDVFDNMVQTIRDVTEADELLFALSDRTNFRKELYPEYKANRKGEKPMAWSALRAHASDKWHAEWLPGLEGDDVIGINSGPGTVIWSIDKDLRTLPGLHVDIASGDIIDISEQDALRNWMMQTLTGDAADNYPGAKNIGKVRAERLLEDVEPTIEAMWPVVVSTFEKSKQTREEAVTMARLARILHPTDYAEKEVQLWTPPTL